MKIKNSKHLILRILAAVILISMLCAAAAGCGLVTKTDFTLPTRTVLPSDDSLKFGSYTYALYDDGNIILTAYSGAEANITIPSTIDGKKVIALGEEMFLQNENIKSVTIGGNIEIIGDYAFLGCSELHSVSISKNVWFIGTSAFDETPWLLSQTEEFVIVGDGVLIGYNGSAKSVRIPDSVKHISSAFGENYDIISAELSDNVLTIGTFSFAFCQELRYVKFGNNLRIIGDYAFMGCEALVAVDIPDRVESIGAQAFNNCYSLITVRLGNSVKTIGEDAFFACWRIRSISLPASIVNIGGFAFGDCYSVGLIFYGGTEEQFAALNILESNYLISDCPKIYNVIGGGHEIPG